MKLRLLLAVATTAVVALTGCSKSSDSTGGTAAIQPAKLTLAIASAVIAPKEEVAVYAVAKEMGFFADEQLTVETINADGSVAALQAVASGSADVTAADAGSILGAVEKNVPVKAIGGLVQNWPWVMAVKPGSPIGSGIDLRGKKDGVISLASGSAPYARAYVRAAGLDPEQDVQLLPVGVGAQATAALNGGQVDALALYTQAYAVIESAGTQLNYLDNPAMFQGIRSLTFAVTQDSLKQHQDVNARFLRAAYRAMLFAATNPEAAMRIGYKVFPQILGGKSVDERLATDTKILLAWLKTAIPAAGTVNESTSWSDISDAEWSKTQDYTIGAGQIKSKLDLARIWDPSLLKDANAFDKKAILDKARSYKG